MVHRSELFTIVNFYELYHQNRKNDKESQACVQFSHLVAAIAIVWLVWRCKALTAPAAIARGL